MDYKKTIVSSKQAWVEFEECPNKHQLIFTEYRYGLPYEISLPKLKPALSNLNAQYAQIFSERGGFFARKFWKNQKQGIYHYDMDCIIDKRKLFDLDDLDTFVNKYFSTNGENPGIATFFNFRLQNDRVIEGSDTFHPLSQPYYDGIKNHGIGFDWCEVDDLVEVEDI